MKADLLAEALKLSPDDRLRLIEALWDTLLEEDLPVTQEERVLLDSRLADLEANPGDQSPWAEVRARPRRSCKTLSVCSPSIGAEEANPGPQGAR